MKKLILMLMALVLLCNPIVCGRASAQNISEDLTDEQNSGNAKNIVVYFSRIGEQYNVGVIEKGNTAIVAEMIAEATGGLIFMRFYRQTTITP